VPTEPAGADLSLRAERWTLGPAGLPRAVDRDQAADARAGQKKLTELVRSRGFTPERKQQPKTTLVLTKLVEQFLAQPR
jgi:hypothetical protein